MIPLRSTPEQPTNICKRLMYAILFIIGLTLDLSLAFYFVVDARAHAQPWRLLAAALFAIVLAFFFDIFAETMNKSVDWLMVPLPKLSDLVKLSNLICSAFAGGLVSVAIANRAKLLHDAATAQLNKELLAVDAKSAAALGQLKGLAAAAVTSDPADKLFRDKALEDIDRILEAVIDERHRVTKTRRSLGLNEVS